MAAIFLSYTQEALDRAYDQRAWASNAQEVIGRYAADSLAVRQQFPPITARYGRGDAETLDIFSPPDAQSLPVMVFIHGGAWRALGKDDASAAAPTFARHGCVFVALNFDNIPATTLAGMVAQCRSALLWLHAHIGKWGGDPNRIFVSGHSSGGHLCGVMLTTDWKTLGGPADLLKGGVTMSGMYELHPVLLSSRGAYMQVTAEEGLEFSPMRQLGRITCPVIVVHGDRESPEFQRHATTFAAALAGMGRLDAQMILAGRNHFEVSEDLNLEDTALSRAVLGLMTGRADDL